MLNDLVIPAGGGTVSIDHAVVSRFGVFVIRSVYAPGLVAGTDDDDRPVVVEPELTPDLVDEVVDVVADATGPVAAEVAQVLANLGGVEAGELGEFLRRHVGDVLVEPLGQDPQVHRQPSDRRVRLRPPRP